MGQDCLLGGDSVVCEVTVLCLEQGYHPWAEVAVLR
jgi:hypothetical protein